MIPRTRGKGKRPSNATNFGPAKHARRDNLTQDDIPTIVEAGVEAVHTRANLEPGGEGHTTHHNTAVQGGSGTRCGAGNRTRNGCQVTHDGTDSQDTQMQGEAAPSPHATYSSDPASEVTEDDTDHNNTEGSYCGSANRRAKIT